MTRTALLLCLLTTAPLAHTFAQAEMGGEGLNPRTQGPVLPGNRITRYLDAVERLKQARLDSGLTQAEAASKLKKPQSFVSKSEAGERRVDAIELEDFARLYGKPLLYFTPLSDHL